jgi:hypothetical protein
MAAEAKSERARMTASALEWNGVFEIVRYME